jgi:hypothetical protein
MTQPRIFPAVIGPTPLMGFYNNRAMYSIAIEQTITTYDKLKGRGLHETTKAFFESIKKAGD